VVARSSETSAEHDWDAQSLPPSDRGITGELDADVLPATKTRPPPRRSAHVVRPRLLQRLADATSAELTVLCTPPGFGKTTLLAEWARTDPRPVAWLSLDRDDTDPIRFWRYIVAALESSCAGLSLQLAPLLSGPRPLPVHLVVATLVNLLAAQPHQIVLVLDDYHLIEAGLIHEAVALLVDRLPNQLRLVISSRSDPPLPLARMRARGQLAELRSADLRFTPDEATALLLQATSRTLDEQTLAVLEARTEGWAVGLQLAGLSLKQHADPGQFVTEFSGTHRYVLDFLTEEVLARQPRQRVQFLLETSVLEYLSGPLCDAVTSGSNSQEMLEELEHDNVFLVALDETRRWWRYHHLFADLLRARLNQTAPERVSTLHTNAAHWCEERGLIDDAIRHALAAADTDWVARMVEQHAESFLLRNEIATVQRWLSALPTNLVQSRSRLSLASAILARMGGRIDDVEPLLGQVEAAYRHEIADSGPPNPSVPRHGWGNVPAMVALQRAELARQRGDAELLITLSHQALAETDPEDGYIRFVVRWDLAMAAFLQGRMVHAEAALAEITPERWIARDAYSALYAGYVRSHAQRALGQLNAARRTCEEAIDAFDNIKPDRALPNLGIAQIGLAEVLLEQGLLDAALEQATSGSALLQQLGYMRWRVIGLTTLARVLQAHGDAAAALATFEDAETAPGNAEAVNDLLNPVAVERARLILAQGDVSAVERWLDSRGLDEHGEPVYAREREYLLLARVLLAQGAAERALELLHRLHAHADAQQRLGSVLEIQVLEVAALDSIDAHSDALAALSEAVVAAEPDGQIRVFVDGGTRIGALLDRLRLPDVSADYQSRLREAFRPTPANRPAQLTHLPTAPVGPGLVEPLSKREQEVLALLASGMSNQQIADELVVTLDTVKKHVSHILDKLEATSRTQAVARARDLALL